MLKKTSADRKPRNEVVGACLYSKGRRCGKTPVKHPVEIDSPFSALRSVLLPTWRFAACFSSPPARPPAPIFLVSFPGGEKLLNLLPSFPLLLLAVRAFGLDPESPVLGRLPSGPQPRGSGALAPPDVARLEPQKPR